MTRLPRRRRPTELGSRLGKATEPRGGEQWVTWDRTAGVIGPQGSGKTLDLLVPALFDAPGAALVTLTKVDDLLLTFGPRNRNGRPCVVLDPFGLVPGLPEVVWDPIRGCVDPMVAERRAKAFTAGTVKGAVAGGHGDAAARFCAAEAAKVLQGFFHAAALVGAGLDEFPRWVARPLAATQPSEILREHPHFAAFRDGLLHGAVHGDERTAGNTITTVQQAMALFFQDEIRRRCVPGPGRDGRGTAVGKVSWVVVHGPVALRGAVAVTDTRVGRLWAAQDLAPSRAIDRSTPRPAALMGTTRPPQPAPGRRRTPPRRVRRRPSAGCADAWRPRRYRTSW